MTKNNLIKLLLSIGLVIFLGYAYNQIMQYGGWLEFTHRQSINDLPTDYRGNLTIFILVGQSNMVGEGSLPPEVLTSPKIWTFGNDYKWKIASEPIDDSTNQVDMVSFDPDPTYSLSTGFSRAYRENDKTIVIGVVPCALGGSSIIEWQRNKSTDTLYGSCLQRVRIASLAGKIQGILIFQGESEANSPILATVENPIIDNYGPLFQQLIVDYRLDLAIDDLPIVYAQVSPAPEESPNKNWLAIQQAQSEIDLDCTDMIITGDLPQMDGLHYDRDELNIIGQRFALAMWNLIDNEKCHLEVFMESNQ